MYRFKFRRCTFRRWFRFYHMCYLRRKHFTSRGLRLKNRNRSLVVSSDLKLYF